MKTIAVPVEPMWGISDEADFDEYTWTFKMSGDYRVAAGAYAIIPEKEYKVLVAALSAAPPQSEPADHLAAPDSRERATNAAATQALISNPAVVACSRCGKVGANMDDGHTCITFCGTPLFSGAITSGLTVSSGFVTNNAAGAEVPNDMMTASYTASGKLTLPAAPDRRTTQRRGSPALPIGEGRWAGADRRQNAAGQDASAGENERPSRGCSPNAPVPAAPATMSLGESALPLSEEQIIDAKKFFAGGFGIELCDQALRAIELDRQLANEQARSRTLVNAAIIATERAENAEKQLAEKDRGYAILHGQFVEMRNRWKIAFDLKEKAEAKLAELRKKERT